MCLLKTIWDSATDFISIHTVYCELLAFLVAEYLWNEIWLLATKSLSFEYHMVSGASYGYIYVLQLYPLSLKPNQWVICLHKRVPFTSSHAGVGPQPEDLLIAHIHFSPYAVQNKPTYTERDVETNFLWMVDYSGKLSRSLNVTYPADTIIN